MAHKVGVIGASGYAGAELLRLISGHPQLELTFAAAGSNAGELITSVHPNLVAFSKWRFSSFDLRMADDIDMLFLALPHGTSGQVTDQLPTGLKVVDLGADHRLQNPDDWHYYYGDSNPSEPWLYGLPELPGRTAEIAKATKVANPGCYATSIELAGAPLLAAGLAKASDIVAVAASGTSGAGRKDSINLSASEVAGSMSAYKVGGIHQHTAEICQELSVVAGENVSLNMTPLLAPMPRGIISTVTLTTNQATTAEELHASLSDAYATSRFVTVLPAGQWPTTGATFGTNSAQLQVAFDEKLSRIVVVCTIDNLGKGAAGQAVQNANLMFGLDEGLGLTVNGVSP